MRNFIYIGVLIVHYLVLFVDSSVTDIPTTGNVIVKQCMDVGGYCQNAWDCCSNRCLSFSYKCVKAQPMSTAYIPSAPIVDPTLLSIETLDDLVNRFGIDDNKTLEQPPTTTSTSTTTASSTIDTNSPCIAIGYKCADSSQCCSNDCLLYLDINICIEKRDPTSTTPTTVSPDERCLVIGQKCYRHEECCTLRCHGFLHQCVT